jgi:RNA polymerase sigma-70 factor (ECF subfamily)
LRLSGLWGRESATAELTGDPALARAAARGDKDAFGELVDRHKRAVHGLCVRLLRDGEEARDAAQEAFVRAYSSLASYDVTQPFAPWLLRIARNHCLDILRRRLPAERQVALDAAPSRDADAPPVRELAEDPEKAAAASPLARLERAELARAVDTAVSKLPANYREVISLFHVDQLSYKEIAGVMGVPIGTVMTWLHRARAAVRADLSEGGVQ